MPAPQKFYQLEAAFLYGPWKQDKLARSNLETELEKFVQQAPASNEYASALSLAATQSYLGHLATADHHSPENNLIKAANLLKDAVTTLAKFILVHPQDAIYLASSLKSHREDLASLYNQLADALYTKSPATAENKDEAKLYYELALEQISLLKITQTPTVYTRQWDMLEVAANIHHQLALLSPIDSKQNKEAIKNHLEKFIDMASNFVVGRDTEKEEGVFSHAESLALMKRDAQMKDKIHTAQVMLQQLSPNKSTTAQIINKIADEPMKLLANNKLDASHHSNHPSISLASETRTSSVNSSDQFNLSSPLSDNDNSPKRGFRS